MGWDGMITPGRTLDILPVPADAGKESLRGWWELPTDRRPRRKWNAAEGIEFVPPTQRKKSEVSLLQLCCCDGDSTLSTRMTGIGFD